MPDISFQCPGCQQPLEAPEEMAGDVVECPACQQQITVPQPAQPQQQKPQVFNINATGAMSAADSIKQAAEAAADQASNKCPECGAEMAAEAVLCVQCGFNIKLGKKITTDFT